MRVNSSGSFVSVVVVVGRSTRRQIGREGRRQRALLGKCWVIIEFLSSILLHMDGWIHHIIAVSSRSVNASIFRVYPFIASRPSCFLCQIAVCICPCLVFCLLAPTVELNTLCIIRRVVEVMKLPVPTCEVTHRNVPPTHPFSCSCVTTQELFSRQNTCCY